MTIFRQPTKYHYQCSITSRRLPPPFGERVCPMRMAARFWQPKSSLVSSCHRPHLSARLSGSQVASGPCSALCPYFVCTTEYRMQNVAHRKVPARMPRKGHEKGKASTLSTRESDQLPAPKRRAPFCGRREGDMPGRREEDRAGRIRGRRTEYLRTFQGRQTSVNGRGRELFQIVMTRYFEVTFFARKFARHSSQEMETWNGTVRRPPQAVFSLAPPRVC